MWLIQAAQSSPSPELLKSITDLIRTAGQSEEKAMITSAHLRAVSEIFGVIAWPSVFMTMCIIFKSEIKGLIKRISKFGMGMVSIEAENKIDKKIESSAVDVLERPNTASAMSVSSKDVQRAVEVAGLSHNVQPDLMKLKIEQIAAEYDGVRANLPSGDERTRKMSAIMAKMRTLGRAAFDFRHDLINHPSAGHRLFAIAALQMLPDYELVDWLAETTRNEAPFIQYQALNALLIAVRNASPQVVHHLRRAVHTVRENLDPKERDRSRWQLMETIENELSQISIRLDINQ